jgi:hypothetical protein
VRADALVVVELALIVGVARRRLGSDRIGRRVLKLIFIDLNDIAAEVRIVSQERPGSGVIGVPDSEESAERQDRVAT